MPRISFCVVNWNGGRTFRRAVDSILAEAAGLDAELVAVDNGSTDGSIEDLPTDGRIRIIRNRRNEYFARATNQSVKAALGDTLVILNNDIIFPPGSLAPYLKALSDHPEEVICPRLRNEDGSQQASIRNLLTPLIFLNSIAPLSGRARLRWILKDFDYDKEQAVEQPLFSLLFMARDTFFRVGYMDESFPLFFNDVDWFKRAVALGVVTRYVPGPAATHSHGYSTRRRPYRKVLSSTTSMARFLLKHYPFRGAVLSPLVALSGAARMAMEMRRRA